jgi:2-octaprenyl-6-methoxyphenol hydroxylase
MYELAIVGGGPVGLSAAIAAACQGLDVVVFESQADKAAGDRRVLALSYGTRLILERLGAWSLLGAAQPIAQVQVSERGSFGAATLCADDLDIPALGYVIHQNHLVRALRERARLLGIGQFTNAPVESLLEGTDEVSLHYRLADQAQDAAAQIAVLAEGGANLAQHIRVTEHDYHQHAIVATLTSNRLARNCAYERFTPLGPIALLPLENAHALIWTVPSEDAAELVALDDARFAQAITSRYGQRIGTVQMQTARASIALKLRFARQVASKRIVLVGNAAQTLHPVAGQGFNLGLRDAYELALALSEHARRGQGLRSGLSAYRSTRRLDRIGGTLFTDFLIRGFCNTRPLVCATRSLALAGFDAFGPAKKFLLRRMIFGAPL